MTHISKLMSLYFLAALLVSSNAFSDQLNFFDLTKTEVAEYGYQVADIWYARVNMAPFPKSISNQSEPHLVRLIGELSEVTAKAGESAENLQRLGQYLNEYLPSQCVTLKDIGYLSNFKDCIEYVKAGATANKDLYMVAIFNMNFGWGAYKVVNIKYIKK